jgi:large subunit ribosomal protein L6
MSRIGRLPIAVPQDVEVNIEGGMVTITGPKGELKRQFNPEMTIAMENSSMVVSRPSDSKIHRSLHGLTRTLLANMVEGVTKGFDKGLEIVGVGYRAEKVGDKVVLRLGFTHQVQLSPPAGLALAVEGANKLKVSGIDKELVGLEAAKIRAIRPPDRYKGKGIRYAGEVIRLKAGKAGKAIGKRA